jgi:hypothetical protein
VAVKVTLCPEQIAPDGFAPILTLGTTEVLIVIVIALEVTVFWATHGEFEVISQVTTWPLVKLLVV